MERAQPSNQSTTMRFAIAMEDLIKICKNPYQNTRIGVYKPQPNIFLSFFLKKRKGWHHADALCIPPAHHHHHQPTLSSSSSTDNHLFCSNKHLRKSEPNTKEICPLFR